MASSWARTPGANLSTNAPIAAVRTGPSTVNYFRDRGIWDSQRVVFSGRGLPKILVDIQYDLQGVAAAQVRQRRLGFLQPDRRSKVDRWWRLTLRVTARERKILLENFVGSQCETKLRETSGGYVPGPP